MQFKAPGDGRKYRLKHVERLTEINKLRIVASCWLYSEIILTMQGPRMLHKLLVLHSASVNVFDCLKYKNSNTQIYNFSTLVTV